MRSMVLLGAQPMRVAARSRHNRMRGPTPWSLPREHRRLDQSVISCMRRLTDSKITAAAPATRVAIA
jgi:hypothetical protein